MATLISGVVGHDQNINTIMTAYHNQHLPHTLLFVGAEGIGKKKTAIALAQFLLCESAQKPCGVCGPCLRVAKGQSESLLLIEPEGLNIKIEQAKKIIEFLQLSNFGRNRVIIIDKAHAMTDQAANALLKTLEEPNSHVFFFLITPEESMLLATIRSRSQTIRFSPVKIELLKKLFPGQPEWTYRCSRGQIHNLEKLIQADGLEKRNQAMILLGQFWNEANFLQITGWREIVKDREQALEILKFWLLIARDGLVLKANSNESVLNLDQRQLLDQIVLTPQILIARFMKMVLQAESDLRHYLDSTLVFESMWVKFSELKMNLSEKGLHAE